VIIGVLIYLFSRMESSDSGQLLMLQEWAMLQLNAPAQSVPLLM
jgi:hypothetical protein